MGRRACEHHTEHVFDVKAHRVGSYVKIVPLTGSGQASWDFVIPSATVYGC
jgi:hypothetical protein